MARVEARRLLSDGALGFAASAVTVIWGGYLVGSQHGLSDIVFVYIRPMGAACAGLVTGAFITTLARRRYRWSLLLVGSIFGLVVGVLAVEEECLAPWAWDWRDFLLNLEGFFYMLMIFELAPFLICYLVMCAVGRLAMGKQEPSSPEV